MVQALREMISGNTSPDETAEWLLGSETSEHHRRHHEVLPESLAQMIQRIGKPPTSVLQQWGQQLGNHDFAQADLNETSMLQGHPLSRWYVDTDGSLSRFGHNEIQPVEDVHEGFDESTEANASHEPVGTNGSGGIFDRPKEEVDGESLALTGNTSKSSNNTYKTRLARWGIVSSLLLASSLTALFFLRSKRNSTESVATVTATREPELRSTTSQTTTSDRPSTNTNQSQPDSPLELESFNELEAYADESGDASIVSVNTLVDSDSMLSSLGDLLAAPSSNHTSNNQNSDDLEDTQPSETSDGQQKEVSSLSTGPSKDALEDDAMIEVAESPQEVKSLTSGSVTLPMLADIKTASIIKGLSIEGLDIEFPMNVAAKLGRSDENDQYFLIDEASSIPLAIIQPANEMERLLSWRWTENAKSKSISNTIHHGRIRDRSGSVVHLRETVVAEPVLFTFDESDLHPTWDLGRTIPPRITRYEISFELPTEVEEAWINPVDSTRPRRDQAIAVISVKDSETVRLGIRFDIKCTSKLSCRIRYAARLDPSLPWETFTTDGLGKYAVQLSSQAKLVEQQLNRIEGIYDVADSYARRRIRPGRDAVKLNLKMLETMMDRLTELQTLTSILSTEARIRFQVRVLWPDGEQVLFSTNRRS